MKGIKWESVSLFIGKRDVQGAEGNPHSTTQKLNPIQQPCSQAL